MGQSYLSSTGRYEVHVLVSYLRQILILSYLHLGLPADLFPCMNFSAHPTSIIISFDARVWGTDSIVKYTINT
jgi:hypothetical protein